MNPVTDAQARHAAGERDGLAILSARLRAARRRLMLNRLVRATAYGVAAGLAGYCLLLTRQWLVAGFASPNTVLSIPAFGIGVGTLAVSSVWAALRLPSRDALARAADRNLGAKERFSTMLEVAVAPERLTAVSHALLAEATRHAASVDARRLVPLRWPRAASAAVALAAVAGLLAVLPPSAGNPAAAPAAAGPGAPLTAQEQQDIAAELRDLSQQLQENADPDAPTALATALETIVPQLESLAEAIEGGEEVDPELLRTLLNALGATVSAGASRPGEAVANANQLLQWLADLLAGIDTATEEFAPQMTPPTEPTDAAGAPAIELPGTADAVTPSSENTTSNDGNTAPTQTAAEAPDAQDSDESESTANPSGEESGGESAPPTPGEPAEAGDPDSEAGDGAEGADPVADDETCLAEAADGCESQAGAGTGRPTRPPSSETDAASSTEAETGETLSIEIEMELLDENAELAGDLADGEAGIGGPDMGNSGAGLLPDAIANSAPMLLPGERIGDGQRISLDSAPLAGDYFLPQAMPADTDGWLRQPEADIRRTPLTPREQSVLSGYFQP